MHVHNRIDIYQISLFEVQLHGNPLKLHWIYAPERWLSSTNYVHRVSKNVPPNEWILIFFGRNVTDKVMQLKDALFVPPQVTCASALPGKMGEHENHIFTQLDCVTHSIHLCAIFLK